MKKKNNGKEQLEDDLLPEYDLDYSKATPNKYAKMNKGRLFELDRDVAEVYNDSKKINNVLRAIINSLPVRPE